MATGTGTENLYLRAKAERKGRGDAADQLGPALLRLAEKDSALGKAALDLARGRDLGFLEALLELCAASREEHVARATDAPDEEEGG